MAGATLLISSKNYSSWSLRGHLLVRLAGLAFEEKVVDPDDPGEPQGAADAVLLDPDPGADA